MKMFKLFRWTHSSSYVILPALAHIHAYHDPFVDITSAQHFPSFILLPPCLLLDRPDITDTFITAWNKKFGPKRNNQIINGGPSGKHIGQLVHFNIIHQL